MGVTTGLPPSRALGQDGTVPSTTRIADSFRSTLTTPDWDEYIQWQSTPVAGRTLLARPEIKLWLACLQNAEFEAIYLGRRKRLAGQSVQLGSSARLAADLREWASGSHVGSLDWIVAEIAEATGLDLTATALRRRILEALDHGGRTPRHQRQNKRTGMIQRRIRPGIVGIGDRVPVSGVSGA